jgi:hypothetical protein
MNEREKFEKWYKSYPEGAELTVGDMLIGDGSDALVGWQACAALKDKRITELELELETKQRQMDGSYKFQVMYIKGLHAERRTLKTKLKAIEKPEPPPLRELADEEYLPMFERIVRDSPDYDPENDDQSMPEEVKVIVRKYTVELLTKARGMK